MINTELFTNRLQEILTFYDLSASAFAEKMGVGRSSISHIVSGRNKPSLDFVLHILENFETVSFDWLMFGKGNFPKSNTPSPSLFSESENITNSENLKNKEVNEKSENLFTNTPEEKNTVKPPNQNTRPNQDIERIVIFYSDNTFKEYKN